MPSNLGNIVRTLLPSSDSRRQAAGSERATSMSLSPELRLQTYYRHVSNARPKIFKCRNKHNLSLAIFLTLVNTAPAMPLLSDSLRQIATPESASLMSLPLELRLHIYYLYFSDTGPKILFREPDDSDHPHDFRRHPLTIKSSPIQTSFVLTQESTRKQRMCSINIILSRWGLVLSTTGHPPEPRSAFPR